jgi:hypothetical protein
MGSQSNKRKSQVSTSGQVPSGESLQIVKSISLVNSRTSGQTIVSLVEAEAIQEWAKLSALAIHILKKNLVTNFGNVLNDEHELCLTKLLTGSAGLALGRDTGRFAYGLDTGYGKTESIVALLSAIHHLKLDHISVMVCQLTVEALCALKRRLMEEGIPEQKIGLVYSPLTTASLPYTKATDLRQFQLVTHNRVKDSRCDIVKQNTYLDKARSLVIWDESFMKSQSKSLSLNELSKAVSNFSIDHRHKQSHEALIKWLQHSLSKLSTEEGSQQINSMPLELALVGLDDGVLTSYTNLLDLWKTYGKSKTHTDWQRELLKELLSMANSPIRLTMSGAVGSQKGQAVVSYEVTVPESFTNMVILDASVAIRDLANMDSSVFNVTDYITPKDYTQVNIHQLFNNGGRDSLTKDFAKETLAERRTSQEVIAVIKSKPTEPFLIFTYNYKPSEGVNFESILRADMASVGIDTHALVEDGKPRFQFLTHGNETSLNGLSYCTNVIMVGVLHLKPDTIDGMIIGQQDNLTHEQDIDEARRVDVSEKVHKIYQALSRGSCRSVNDGKALPMTAYLLHRSLDVREGLNKVMRNVNWLEWTSCLTDSKTNGQKLSVDILSYLEATPSVNFPLSIRSVKADLKVTSATTWQRALANTLSMTARFTKVGRSIHSV